MRTCTITFHGTAPYSQSRKHDIPKPQQDTHEVHDENTWREKCNVNADGEVVIPAMAFKQSIAAAAKRMGLQIPNKGKATYTKFFESDVICTGDVPIGVFKDSIGSIAIQANSDGVRGSGKRVRRIFPQTDQWSGTAEFLLVDDNIPNDVFERVVTTAGIGVGVGRFRPENGGMNGRFSVDSFTWVEV